MRKKENIILFHGSDILVTQPSLAQCKPNHDFGLAFYLTTDWNQAYRWAIRKSKRRRYSGQPVVSKYELKLEELDSFNYKVWKNVSKDWLDFIVKNRSNKSFAKKQQFDVIVGPVIDGSYSWDTLALYKAGKVTFQDAVHELHPENLTDQWAFKTQKAIDILEFKGEVNNEDN